MTRTELHRSRPGRPQPRPEINALVVYFSRSGYTRRIAEEIARRLPADLNPILERHDRSGWFGYLRSGFEAYKHRTPPILPAVKDAAAYDLVVLGTPVWAGNIASPMRSYLTAHGHELNRVAFFCTQGGSGAEAVLKDMATLSRREPIATLVLNDAEIKADSHASKLDAFVRELTPQGAPRAAVG